MKKNNKVITYFIIFSLLIIGVVFAILQANLQINGTAKIQANTWDIHFDNIQVISNSVSIGNDDTPATIDPENNCKVDFEVTLSTPGDFYEFTVDVVNAGTIDGMIGELNKTLKVNNEIVSEVPDYLEYSVTYADGMEISENYKLAAGVTETYKVKLEFKTDIEELPEATTITTSLEPQYLQADASSVVRPNVFVYGTWEQIIDTYNSGNLASLQEAMEEGEMREVQLDKNYDGTSDTIAHVRIANLSTPSECETTGFSQTACGFVIEFTELLFTHRMNPYSKNKSSNGNGNKGGWEYSDMRAYLNSEKYLEGETGSKDYSTIGFYNMLSSDLKSKIIDTTVVSGYGLSDSANFITTDKLYLLDGKEIFGTSFTSSYNTAKGQERQLDFYRFKNVTTSNYSMAKKTDLSGYGNYCWLRSSVNSTEDRFAILLSDGSYLSIESSDMYVTYISPAFRIAS